MSRGGKILLSILGVLVLLVLIALAVWNRFTHQAFPVTEGAVTVSGLREAVEIVRDEYGVAHLYGHHPEDLFFAEGYVHAQERFWQMEFQRRVAAGRMAELFGETALSTDRFLRHFDFRDRAQLDYEMMPANGQQIIDAYTAGVNAYISQRKPSQLGLEFAFLELQGVDVFVEPWTQADTMSWAYMMILDQSGFRGTPSDILNADLLNTVGPELYADLRPRYRDDRPVIISTDELAAMGLPTSGSDQAYWPDGWPFLSSEFSGFEEEPISAAPGPDSFLAEIGFGFAGGSNSFAIRGERVATGKPILANDPHMSVNAPSLFYQIGVHCIEISEACHLNFRGFSLPGVPGILIGHNEYLAWGLTNASFDAEDIFIEKINPDNPDQYEVNGEWVDMDIRQETIKVQGWSEAEVVSVRSTRNGVVASDALMDPAEYNLGEGLPDPYAVIYAWTALEPVRSVYALIEVIHAQSWGEFNDALQYFDAGKQNWIYADVEGNIGFVTPGKVPIRAKGDGTLPVPGWTDEYVWTGFIPYEEAPRVFNPEKGYIVTGNNPQVKAADYPYLINIYQDRGQRAQRTTEMIEQLGQGITVEDAQIIQGDNGGISALEVIPYLETLAFTDPAVIAARDRLLRWDAQMNMESTEAVIYNFFWSHLVKELFYDRLPEMHYPSGNHETADSVYLLLQEPESTWWDDNTTVEVETRDDILVRAMVNGYADGVARFGDDLDEWRWGELHTITFRNATLGNAGISFIENIFNRGPFETGGSESVPQKTCWSIQSGSFEVTCIPHLRQVIDFSDLANSQMINQLGQSGHPMHPQYDNFVEKWRHIEYIPNNWLREDVEKGPHDRLLLQPG